MTIPGKVAVVAGATGLVGGMLARLLLAEGYYGRVIMPTRRPLPFDHPRAVPITTDLDHLGSVASQLAADDVYCCLGTTMAKAGSRAAFRKVDYDYPLALARIAKAGGARQFLLVSSMGADTKSAIFYNRVKGEVEAAVAAVGFDGLGIYRPGLLLGPRPEARTGEGIAQAVFKALNFAFVGPLARYRAIPAAKVAAAMATTARAGIEGTRVIGSLAMQKFDTHA